MTSPQSQSAPPRVSEDSEQELPQNLIWAIVAIHTIIMTLYAAGYSKIIYWLGFLLTALLFWHHIFPGVPDRITIYFCFSVLFLVLTFWQDIVGEGPLPVELDDWPDIVVSEGVSLGPSDAAGYSKIIFGLIFLLAVLELLFRLADFGPDDASNAGPDGVSGSESEVESVLVHEVDDFSDASSEDSLFTSKYDTEYFSSDDSDIDDFDIDDFDVVHFDMGGFDIDDFDINDFEPDESESEADTQDLDAIEVDVESDQDIYDLEAVVGDGAGTKNATGITPPVEDNSSFPFMRLPQELKDRIYKEYLTEPYGLVYTRHPRNRVVLSRLRRPINNPIGNEEWRPEDLGPFEPANQLQYVSRKLRQDTRGLGVRYNDITFLSLFRNLPHDPGTQPRKFFDALPASIGWQKALAKRQWNIMLHHADHYSIRDSYLRLFATFLRGSPNNPSRIWRFLQQDADFKVNVRMACFDPGNVWHRAPMRSGFPYLSQLIVAADMRGQQVAERYRDLVAKESRFVLRPRTRIDERDRLPDNVRVKPFSFEFHEHAFLWAHVHKCQHVKCDMIRFTLEFYHDSPQQAVKLLKLLYKEGC